MEEMKNTEQELTLEEGFARLDRMVEQLEDPAVSLEDSFRLYEQGMKLLKQCSEKIDTVEKKMLLMQENGEFSEF